LSATGPEAPDAVVRPRRVAVLRPLTRPILCLLLLFAVPACRQDMHDQPKVEPLESSSFFEDGRGSRPGVAETVARGWLGDDDHLQTGKIGKKFVRTFPYSMDLARLRRGRERYDIFCSPCHDRTGSGNGMIVQRGYRRPPSFHEERLREAAVGYIYDTIVRGFGAMPSYAPQIPVADRWAIVAYVRALQLSQNARLSDVPLQERTALDRAAAAAYPQPAGQDRPLPEAGHE
jgi:mono/diheme cytochrome c family protein